MRCLFIGGPKAGCVIDVDDRIGNVEIPIDGGVFRYVKGQIQNAGCQRVCIFHSNGEDPLITLMNFYAEAHKQ